MGSYLWMKTANLRGDTGEHGLSRIIFKVSALNDTFGKFVVSSYKTPVVLSNFNFIIRYFPETINVIIKNDKTID
jgi:hypothetical protein